MNVLILSIIGIVFCTSLLFFSWLGARRHDFYSMVDVVWSYGLGFLALLYGILGQGALIRRSLLVMMGLAWGLRLGTHLLFRLKEQFPKEDRRYLQLKKEWGPASEKKFFWFFQFQALSQPLLALPFAFAASQAGPLTFVDMTGLIIFCVGLIGESTADAQLRLFKNHPENQGRVCDLGLWRFSRHPNYFFEWVVWCGFALVGLSPAWGLLSLLSPLFMFYILNFMTGVPLAESQSLASKGELYRRYQRQTSRFFPWFPRIERRAL